MNSVKKIELFESEKKQVPAVKSTTKRTTRAILNIDPKTIKDKRGNSIVRQNKLTNGSNFLEIGNVEELLTAVFDKWEIPEMNISYVLNGVVVSLKLRVTYKEGGTKEVYGVAGKAFQMDKGASKFDATSVKFNAVEIAPAIAKTQALKNACKMLGRIFGSHLNREGVDEVVDFSKNSENEKNAENNYLESIKSRVSDIRNYADLKLFVMNLSDQDFSNSKIMEIVKNQKQNIKLLCED